MRHIFEKNKFGDIGFIYGYNIVGNTTPRRDVNISQNLVLTGESPVDEGDRRPEGQGIENWKEIFSTNVEKQNDDPWPDFLNRNKVYSFC